MKTARLIFLSVFVLTTMNLLAQVNPKDGYIITNDNDTVKGVIDYRSDSHNSETCSFKAAGSSMFRNYQPGQIKGYRLMDNGVYYVAKTFPVDGINKTFFAEYLIEGGVSLYHHQENLEDYYYMVGEDGKVAALKGMKHFYDTPEEKKEALKQNMKGVVTVLKKSPEAVGKMNRSSFNGSDLSGIVRDYDMKYCQSAGDCIQFNYDRKEAASERIRLKISAGVDVASPVFISSISSNDIKVSQMMPTIGVGGEFWFSRSSRKFCAEALLNASYFNKTFNYDFISDQYTNESIKDAMVKFFNLEEQIGVAYHFSDARVVTPVLSAGLSLNEMMSKKTRNVEQTSMAQSVDSQSFSAGGYLGAGVDVPIGKHDLDISGKVTYRRYHVEGIRYFAIGVFCSYTL